MKLLTLMLLLTAFTVRSPQYKLITKIELPTTMMTTDPLGYCYVESKNRIYKYDQDGTPINKYSNNNFAGISSIDATNPYKVLVFYQSLGKLVYLDNMLSQNGDPIDLISSDFNQATLVCASFDNGYWLYEPLLNELFKLNASMNVLQQSGNLSRILRQKLNPNFLIEFNSRVYLNNPGSGILVFDQYGTYLKTIPLPDLKSFQVRDDRIYFLRDGKLLTYYFQSLETDTTDLPIREKVLSVQIQKKRMYLITDRELQIYQIN